MNRVKKLETKRNFYAPDSMWEEIEKIADEKFEGNFSMAVRYLVQLGIDKVGEQNGEV